MPVMLNTVGNGNLSVQQLGCQRDFIGGTKEGQTASEMAGQMFVNVREYSRSFKRD